MFIFHIGAVLLAALSFSSISIAVRYASIEGMPQMFLAFMRGAVPVILIGIYALFKRPDDLRFKAREVPELMFYGFFGMVLMYTAANAAVIRLPVNIASLLFYTTPLWVIIGGRLLRLEAMTKLRAIALLLGICGVFLAVGGVGELRLDAFGVTAALSAGLSNAVYMLGGRYGLGRDKPFKLYLHTFIWGSLVLGIISFMTGEWHTAFAVKPAGWLYAVYLGLVPSLIGNACLIYGLHKLPSSTVSIVVMMEIAFASFWAWIFFGEMPGLGAISGGFLLIGAILLIIREGKAHESLDVKSS